MMVRKILQVLIISIFAVLVFGGIFELFRANGIFDLRAVQIYGNNFVTKDEIARLAEFDFTKDIFEIDLDELEKRISRQPMIDLVKISRSLPGFLKVEIKEHQLVSGIAGSEIVAASEKWDLIENYPSEALYDLPVITGIHLKTDENGTRTPEQPEMLKYCIKVLKTIREKDPTLYADISELNYDENAGITLILRQTQLPVLLGKSNIASNLNAFSTIYHKRLRHEKLASIAYIDARFQSQVILKKKT